MTTLFVGDVGTEIALDCGVDISTATVRNIVVRKSNGAKVTWAASADGTDGVVYTTLADDINVAGPWSLQAYIEMPGWKGYGAVVKLNVINPV